MGLSVTRRTSTLLVTARVTSKQGRENIGRCSGKGIINMRIVSPIKFKTAAL